ncbi:MAG: hypothetical protein KAQ92_00690 [Candidatus Aenigmarchaeota archaeon]|nr:hypothetical protein [Candidatus Aenigmarchaeota archaeon]
MIIKKADSKIEKISSKGNVWDYPMPTKQVDIALQELEGRVPDRDVIKIQYAMSSVKANKKSYIETKNLKMITVTKPNWYESQYKLIKE